MVTSTLPVRYDLQEICSDCSPVLCFFFSRISKMPGARIIKTSVLASVNVAYFCHVASEILIQAVERVNEHTGEPGYSL